METRTAHLDITGMTCANCSGTVGDALESLDGVIEANANFATDEGSVKYDPDEVSLAEIYEAIDEAGYGAVSDTVTIGISDMTCANCVQTNETALDFATDEAQVRYNPADTSLDALYDAIEDAGYSPVREDSDSGESGEDARDAARQGEIRKQLRLTLFGAALSAPMLFFLAEKFLLGGGILPETIFGVEFGWVEFLLATPVQAVLGWPFYKNS
ncbi:MAG: cation transporter, partial [Halobacteriota archaeon]